MTLIRCSISGFPGPSLMSCTTASESTTVLVTGKRSNRLLLPRTQRPSSRKKFSPARRHLGPQRSVKVKRSERCRSFGQMARTRIPVERTWNGFSVPATCLVGPGTRSDIRSLAVLCAQKRSLQARPPLHPWRQSCAVVTTDGYTPRPFRRWPSSPFCRQVATQCPGRACKRSLTHSWSSGSLVMIV
jgi:hypothetical protein